MKDNKASKFFILLSVVGFGAANAEIVLKIDQDLTSGNVPIIPVLPLNGDALYLSGVSQVHLESKHAVICNQVDGYQPFSALKVRLTDPNGDNKGDQTQFDSLMGAATHVNYDFRDRALSVNTEYRSKALCISSPEFDVIFEDGYGDLPTTPASDISYVLNNPPVSGYTPGSYVNYNVVYENSTGASQLLDFIEYHPYTNASAAYFNPGGNINCDVLDASDDVVQGQVCISFDGVVKDVNLSPGHKIKLTVVRQISAAAQVGSNIELMAAAFTKVSTIDSDPGNQIEASGSSQSFSGFDMQALKIPVVAQ